MIIKPITSFRVFNQESLDGAVQRYIASHVKTGIALGIIRGIADNREYYAGTVSLKDASHLITDIFKTESGYFVSVQPIIGTPAGALLQTVIDTVTFSWAAIGRVEFDSPDKTSTISFPEEILQVEAIIR